MKISYGVGDQKLNDCSGPACRKWEKKFISTLIAQKTTTASVYYIKRTYYTVENFYFTSTCRKYATLKKIVILGSSKVEKKKI